MGALKLRENLCAKPYFNFNCIYVSQQVDITQNFNKIEHTNHYLYMFNMPFKTEMS